MPLALDDLRRFAVARSLFPPTTLKRALHEMGFVQADPIRAPARAQDLILRHRVKNYHADDLERQYAKLGVHEDFFINYGFVTSEMQALMHPRSNRRVRELGSMPCLGGRRKKAQLLLDFVRERGVVHPRDLDSHFSQGKVANYWGGNSNATTHLLDLMHYQGLLRVVRRESGVRLYSVHQHATLPIDNVVRSARLDALVDAALQVYAPVPEVTLKYLVRRLRLAAPQWERYLTATLKRARERLPQANVEGTNWYWLPGEDPTDSAEQKGVRLLAPFDPVVWDRERFELLWGWVYRFEAYTPPAKRVRGYYAMPLLWCDRVIGWANLAVKDGELRAELGYVNSPTRSSEFRRELEAELERVREFLRLKRGESRSRS
jgi:uncharacterized protein YcaQ